MQRNKGKRWEQEVAACLRKIFGESVRRGWQARAGGDDPDIVDVPNFWIEAKHHKVVNIGAAIRQVLTAKKKNDPRWPLIVSKSDRQEPLATMTWGNFLEILHQWWESIETNEELGSKLAALTPKRDDLLSLVTAAQGVLPILEQSNYRDPNPAITRFIEAMFKIGSKPNVTSLEVSRNESTLQPAIVDAR